MTESVVYKTSYEVDRGQLYVRAFGRDTNKARVDLRISGTEPYLFVPTSEVDKARGLPEVVSILPGPPDTQGRPTSKIVTRYPFDVPNVREHFSFHHEADVVYSVRVRGEYHLNYLDLSQPTGTVPASALRPLASRPLVTPRTIHFDIEVQDEHGFARPEKPENPVIAVGFYDTYKNAFGCCYNGPELDPEAVRAEMQAHVPSTLPLKIDQPIRLLPSTSEKEIVSRFGFLLHAAEPDVLSAYNGDKYDFPYLAGRAERLLSDDPANDDLLRVYFSLDKHRSINSGRYALADPLAIFRKQELRQRSFSLESVATDFLGFGKLPRPGTVGELRRTDPLRFVAYNLLDVLLLAELDRKKRWIDYAIRIAMAGNVELSDILYNSRVVDGLLFDVARETGTPILAMPSKDFAPKTQRKGKGAEVFPVLAGIHQAVVGIDFSEEYPCLTQTFNIGPETVVPPGTPDAYALPTGGWYRKQPKGIVYRGLARIRQIRKEAKAVVRASPMGSPERDEADTVSKAVKFLINSVDGVLGSGDWRLGNVAMFEDVTGMARLHLQTKKRLLENSEWMEKALGFPAKAVVISGDTDSTYFKLYDGTGNQVLDLDRLNTEIVPRLVAALNEEYGRFFASLGATENFTSDSVEGIFERFRTLPAAKSGDSEVGAKKRYFGLYAFDEDRDVRNLPFAKRVKYVGIEIKRRNNAPITKQMQTKIVELVLTGRPVAELLEYLDGIRADVLAGKRDDELLIPTSYSKERSSYESVFDYIRAIDNYQLLTGRVVFPGDEFQWCFVRGGVRYARNASDVGERFEEFAIPYSMTLDEARKAGFSFEIDRKAMVEKCIDGPAQNVAPEIEGSVAGMGEEW